MAVAVVDVVAADDVVVGDDDAVQHDEVKGIRHRDQHHISGTWTCTADYQQFREHQTGRSREETQTPSFLWPRPLSLHQMRHFLYCLE